MKDYLLEKDDEKNELIEQKNHKSSISDLHPHHTTHGHKSHIYHYDDEHILYGDSGNDFKGDKDPLLIFENEVAEDFYALSWCALKKNIWEEKYIYGVSIFLSPKDLFFLIFDFFLFACLISFTICIMLYQTFTTGTFKFGNWRIELLRILVVTFAQKLLYPEYNKGSTKFRYTLKHWNDFNYPWMAAFITFWQCLMTLISYILIVIFMCISNEALPLVMHFAEVAILIELDDWIGESICKEFPDEEGQKPHDVELGDLNSELHLYSKLALVREDLHIILDYNIAYDSSFLQYCSTFISYFPWYLMPLISTLGFEAFMYYVQPTMIS